MTAASSRPPRLPGVDVARGLAVILMIETHAYDAWVSPVSKGSYGYHLTRVLSSIPSALFLLLAGVGLALAGQGSARRGLSLVLYGYGVSLIYALIEGGAAPSELLRADILHCIGLSLAVCSLVLLPVSGAQRLWRAGVLCALAVAAQPLLRAAGVTPLLAALGQAPGVLRLPAALLALLVDVPPYTRFPLLPLLCYPVVGVLTGDWLRGAAWPSRWYLGAALLCALIASAVTESSLWAVAHLGVIIDRSHPAVLASIINQCTRALAVLLLALALPAVPRLLRWLVQLGRHSLLAYAFHIPLCYGRFARPIRGRLDMIQATGMVIALTALTYAVVVFVKRPAPQGRSGPPSAVK